MGEVTSCCNPSTHLNNQIDVSSLPNQPLYLQKKSNPIQQFTEPNKLILQTLKKGQQYLQYPRQSPAANEPQQLWHITARTPDKHVTIYCRGGQDKQLNGTATLYFPNREVYRGLITNNNPTKGVFVFRAGCYYAGEIKNSNAEGKGKFQNVDTGYIYEGLWSKSLPHGLGNQIYSNGDIFEGQLSYGAKFGNGTYFFSNGNIYEGSFYSNQSDGHGKLTYPNGNYYEGQWKLGQFYGKGKFVWANGELYEGDYVDGKRHGHGKYRFKNGSYYEGSWAFGHQQGEGVIKDKFDEIKGTWSQGELIQ